MSTQFRPGYKQTEVGVIPDDWEVKPLHDLADKIMVGIASAATHAYRDRGVVMFRNQNIKPGYLDDSDLLYIAEEYEATFRNKRLKAGDLLTARTGYPGTTSIVPSQYEGAQSFTTLITRPRPGVIDPEYLCIFINSESGQAYFEQNQIGGGQKNVNAGSLKHLPVAFPPAEVEQRAIAEALSDADALIESLEQLLAKKRHLKQGTMQELLTGKKRLPGFQVKLGYKHTEAGPVPEDWDVVSMGQVSECLIGLTYSPLDVRDFGTLVLRSSNVQNGRLAFEDNVFVEMEIPDRAIARKDDILICVRNGSRQLIGKCALIDDATAGSAFGAFMSVLRSTSAKFLFFQFQSGYQKRQIDEVMGATINQITNKDLAEFKVIWPSDVDERTAIAAVLSDMDSEITELETQLAKTRTLKLGMMHKLLTGEIRLI